MHVKKNSLTPIERRMIKSGNKFAKEGKFVSEDAIEGWNKDHNELISNRMIKDSCDEFKKHIAKQPEPHEQLMFSFVPTAMTRVSPFFPLSRKQMKDRPMLKKLTWNTSWGRIKATGEMLSVYDESVLLSLLHLVKKHRSGTFLTTQGELCKIANVARSKDTYNAIWQSIDRMIGFKINIEIWEGKGKSRKLRKELGGTMFSFAGRDKKTGKLKIVLNTYFLRMYGEGFLTNMDLEFRAGLKGDITKSLYRFYLGQKPFYKNGKYRIDLLKLCRAINLSIEDVAIHRLRTEVRKGLRELRKPRKTGAFLARWELNKDDIITVWKSGHKKVSR